MDDFNGGNSVVVRIYELKDRKNFDRAFRDSFWSDDVRALGDSAVIRKYEVILLPDRPQELRMDLSAEAAFIGAAADFRAPAGEGWKTVIPVPSRRKDVIRVIIRPGVVEITGS